MSTPWLVGINYRIRCCLGGSVPHLCFISIYSVLRCQIKQICVRSFGFFTYQLIHNLFKYVQYKLIISMFSPIWISRWFTDWTFERLNIEVHTSKGWTFNMIQPIIRPSVERRTSNDNAWNTTRRRKDWTSERQIGQPWNLLYIMRSL